MIPTLSVPNIQIAPLVEQSVFTGQNADAALGRLPVVTVPPTIANVKVADNRPGQAHARPPAQPEAAGQGEGAAPFSLGGSGELAFESPYSTTFVAQLFGQFQTSDATLGALGGESAELPLGFIDFERLSQFDVTKYMPSFAFGPRVPRSEAAAQPPAVPAATTGDALRQAAPAPAPFDLASLEPVSNDLNPLPQPQAVAPPPPAGGTTAPQSQPIAAPITASDIFTRGFGAYGATQSRNLASAFIGQRGGAEISLVL